MLDSQRHSFGILATYEDVTERKRAEDVIKRSNTALAEFAHVVSHDLQSPVRVARNYIQLVVRKYGNQLNLDGCNLLQEIEDGLVHMHELIRSLLAYATATEPDPAGQNVVSLRSVLERAVSNLQLLVQETQAEITHDELPVLTGHETQLVQIFQNLISNAIKYRKPEIAPRIHITGMDMPHEWVICIRDNGIGIAPEDQDRVFTPLKPEGFCCPVSVLAVAVRGGTGP